MGVCQQLGVTNVQGHAPQVHVLGAPALQGLSIEPRLLGGGRDGSLHAAYSGMHGPCAVACTASWGAASAVPGQLLHINRRSSDMPVLPWCQHPVALPGAFASRPRSFCWLRARITCVKAPEFGVAAVQRCGA